MGLLALAINFDFVGQFQSENVIRGHIISAQFSYKHPVKPGSIYFGTPKGLSIYTVTIELNFIIWCVQFHPLCLTFY